MESSDMSLLYPELSYNIRGAIYEVYKTLGVGLLESVYQEALALEFEQREIPFEAKKRLHLEYKGMPLKQTYELDFLCYDKIILELKSVESLARIHFAQLENYLRLTGCRLGMLVNFNHVPKAEIKRIVV